MRFERNGGSQNVLIYLISRRYFAQDRNSMIFFFHELFYTFFLVNIFFAVPCYGVLVHSPRVTILLLSVIILFYFFFLQPRSVSYTLWLDFDCASIIGFRLAECCKKKLPNIKFCLLDIAFDGSLQYLSLLFHL